MFKKYLASIIKKKPGILIGGLLVIAIGIYILRSPLSDTIFFHASQANNTMISQPIGITPSGEADIPDELTIVHSDPFPISQYRDPRTGILIEGVTDELIVTTKNIWTIPTLGTNLLNSLTGESAADANVRAIAKAYNLVILNRILDNHYLLKIPIRGNLETIWGQLSNDARISYVNINGIIKTAYTPNDKQLSKKPELNLINAKEAWDIVKGGPANPQTYPVYIAIIDTGVDLDHPDLTDNIATDAQGKKLGYSALPCQEKDQTYTDGRECVGGMGHGTHVAGIAAEVGDNWLEAAGLAYSTKILPIRAVGSDGLANVSDVAKGLFYVLNTLEVKDKVKVINLSIGHYNPANPLLSPQLAVLFDTAYYQNKVIIVSAGNENSSTMVSDFAQSNSVLTVAAIDNTNKRWQEPNGKEGSNYGPKIDLTAYGTNIYSTMLDNTYVYGSGTSMAVPLVSGAVALLFANEPNLTAQGAIDIITQFSMPNTDWNHYFTGELGCGIVNPYLALTSQAPLVSSPGCFLNWQLGYDIDINWYPRPGTSPDRYVIDLYTTNMYGNAVRPLFIPQDGSGMNMGLLTHWTYKSVDIEQSLPDGDWRWKVGAVIDGTTYWGGVHQVKKVTHAELVKPTSSYQVHVIGPNEIFDWNYPPNQSNIPAYIARVTPYYGGPNWGGKTIYYPLLTLPSNFNLTPDLYKLFDAGLYYWAITATALTGITGPDDLRLPRLSYQGYASYNTFGVAMIDVGDITGLNNRTSKFSVKTNTVVGFRNLTKISHQLVFDDGAYPPITLQPGELVTKTMDIIGKHYWHCGFSKSDEDEHSIKYEYGYIEVTP